MALDPDRCYEAFRSRDRRFDGRFFAAVTSTGIYCRPGCPARLPRRAHLRFYRSAAAAEESGFRPCMRCRPDTAAGPVLDGTASTVRRALRLISGGALDGANVDALASRLGVTSRHLRRLFHEHLGASPRAIAMTRRLHFARQLVEGTQLPLTEVAHGSGFGSLRRFNDAFVRTFRRPPRAFRRGRRGEEPHDLELNVALREPYDWAGTLAFLGNRAIPGVECVVDGVYRRTVAASRPGECAGDGWIEVRRLPSRPALTVRVHADASRDLLAIAERVGRLFDVEADTTAIATVLSRDTLLRPVLRRCTGLRVPGAFDRWEIAVRAVLGQQVSVAAARTLAGRLVLRAGSPLATRSQAGVTHVFPDAATIATADLDGLGLTGARVATLHGLAAAVADGTLDLDRLTDPEDLMRRLVALPGIGAWTASYVAMRALGEPDAFPAADLGVRQALAIGGNLPSSAAAMERADRWRPWRAYAVMALWRLPTTRSAAPRSRRTRRRHPTQEES